jgi:hypothetical protein
MRGQSGGTIFRPGTEAQGLSGGHGRADTVAAGFVAGRGDDAARIRLPTDDERRARVLTVVEEVDVDVECVHVNMKHDGGES